MLDAMREWGLWGAIVEILGGPPAVVGWLAAALWVLLVLVCVAAVLGAVVAEMKPWMPTAPGEGAEWQETQPMPLMGREGLVDETPAPPSRKRPTWLG